MTARSTFTLHWHLAKLTCILEIFRILLTSWQFWSNYSPGSCTTTRSFNLPHMPSYMNTAATLFNAILHSLCLKKTFNEQDLNSTQLNQPTAVPSRAETRAATRTQTPHATAEQLLSWRCFSQFLAKPPGQLCTNYLKIKTYLLYIKDLIIYWF